jgi:hypothetical protein
MSYCSLMVKRLTVTRSLLKLDFNSFGQKIMFESFNNPPERGVIQGDGGNR